MSFVTFSSRTRSRSARVSGRGARCNMNASAQNAKPPLRAIVDALNHCEPTFRPFHISRKRTMSASMSGAKVKRVREYMRKMENPATSLSIEKQLPRFGMALTRVSKDKCIENGDERGKAYANCSLPAIPDDSTNPVLPQDPQALVEKTSDVKDVLDSVRDIPSSPVSPLATCLSTSMSRRRSSCNMPTLQRILPLNCVPQYNIHGFEGFRIPFPVHPCSTPITPLDQIIHTPRDPPVLHPDARRGSWSPIIGTSSNFDSPQVSSPSMSPSVRVAARVRRTMPLPFDRRRLSIVAPPEARPMHAPRRLSYSKAFGKHNSSSPLSSRRNSATLGEGLACCPENDLLASPLAIRPSASGSQRAMLDTYGAEGIFSKDFSFSFSVKPQAARV